MITVRRTVLLTALLAAALGPILVLGVTGSTGQAARNNPRHTDRAIIRDQEMVRKHAASGQPVAWFPEKLRDVTTSPSDNQWAGMMLGDESYAQCKNWQNLESTIEDIFGYPYIIPAHQGRACENYLFEHLLEEKKGMQRCWI